MPIFLFSIRISPESEVELQEVVAPDFASAVQALATTCPGVQVLKLEGVYAHSPPHA